jgi:transposase InsO family protein
MNASHDTAIKPSILLAIVCLDVVHRLHPEWLSVKLEEAARGENISPQRLSRLGTRAIAPFQRALDILTRIGRPRREKEEQAAIEEVALLRSLLGVATAILKHVSKRKSSIRALVVGAYLRLKQVHPELRQKSFCETFSLSQRTFRDWMRKARPSDLRATPVAPMPKKKSPRKRPLRRPRFGFQVTIPDTQLAADTTDLSAFDIPLKLIAAQDIGGRDGDLLDSIIVDDHESAELVVKAITEALHGQEGLQVLTDQGTPYMAEATRAALDELGAEHAPQKEGHPQGKATIERALGSIKAFASPILELTSKIAAAVPGLREPNLAKAVTTLLLTALLKAYQAGARAKRRADAERRGISPEELSSLAEQSRNNARAEERSSRLFLSNLHRDYEIQRPLSVFIRQMRRFPLAVLKKAERDFSSQVHRDDIRDRASYFAAIARKWNDEYWRQVEKERRQKKEENRINSESRRVEAQHAAWFAEPAAWLNDALHALADQWIPEPGVMLCGGAGLGRKWLIDAIDRIIELNGHTAAVDIAQGIFKNFESADPRAIGSRGLCALRAIFESTLEKKQIIKTDCYPSFSSAILRNHGP